MRFSRTDRWAIVAAASLALAGCSQPERTDRLPTYPVSGRVLQHGQPAEGAQVQIWAQEGGLKTAGLCPHGTVEADGSFRLTTYATGDGAPAGAYAVTLTWPLPPAPGQDQGPDRFHGLHADPSRPLRQVRVVAEENVLAPIDLE